MILNTIPVSSRHRVTLTLISDTSIQRVAGSVVLCMGGLGATFYAMLHRYQNKVGNARVGQCTFSLSIPLTFSLSLALLLSILTLLFITYHTVEYNIAHARSPLEQSAASSGRYNPVSLNAILLSAAAAQDDVESVGLSAAHLPATMFVHGRNHSHQEKEKPEGKEKEKEH